MVPTLTPTEATEPMDTVTLTPTDTTARGLLSPLLRLSPRPLLTHGTPMVPMDWAMQDTTVWATEHTDMLDTPTPIMVMPTMARGPLRLSPPLLPSLLPMLMPTTGTTVMVPGPTTDWDTEDTDWATEATTGDKFSASEVQSRSSKANITPCYLT